ncbi:hypothetical protein C8P68_10428 [Mucilaginibacter yixingensis]|uniref:Uncharacterized protein n=1 Tax=Mucilaginibacter yixingensis TaxID=1295612 RepID=A0A2T5J954_9SPHI|nr:hypothetical protein C8P68_10428 [Mucilaginibacter yixingensis]
MKSQIYQILDFCFSVKCFCMKESEELSGGTSRGAAVTQLGLGSAALSLIPLLEHALAECRTEKNGK